MATIRTAQVIPFPQRNRGRVRKSESLGTMGVTALHMFGLRQPENVALLDEARLTEPVCEEDMTSLLAVSLYATATKGQRERLVTCVRALRCDDRRTTRQRAIASALLRCLGRL